MEAAISTPEYLVSPEGIAHNALVRCLTTARAAFQIDHANDSLTQYPQSTAATRPNTPSNSMHASGTGLAHALGALVNRCFAS